MTILADCQKCNDGKPCDYCRGIHDGMERAAKIAEGLEIDRFGKLERYQVADAIRKAVEQ